MLISHERERLLNAIVYFAEHTNHCGKTKLIKLLFLLDFEHYRATGRSVTGLDYFAWPKGPVPVCLHSELDEPNADMVETLCIRPEWVFRYKRMKIVPRRSFDPSHFSKRELRLLESLSIEYKTKNAEEMVEVTHAENGAWARVWADGLGLNEKIPYELAVDGENSAAVFEMAREHDEIKRQYA